MTRKKLLLAAMMSLGCAAAGGEPGTYIAAATTPQTTPPVAAFKAEAELAPTAGNTAAGTVVFSELESGLVRITGEISGLTPGKHGFHIHETGDCSASDAESAGDHFSVGEHPHGSPDDALEARHTGDLGNIEANSDGVAVIDILDKVIDLTGPASIIGRAVIVHQEADDLKSQPGGAAGARLACGAIKSAAVA